jgi:hypothetical protein
MGALQVEPERRLGAEPVPEAKGSIAGDRALAGDDLWLTRFGGTSICRANSVGVTPSSSSSSFRISPG